MEHPDEAAPRGYPALLGGLASWFSFWGMQQVSFQWLVVDRLASSPADVGTAQMAMTTPTLLVVLFAGAAADRVDPRRLLLGVHLAGAAVAAGLCLLIASDALSYSALLVYGLCVGTLQAFAIPARDTQLSDVIRGGMSKAIAGVSVTRHAAQLTGSLLATSISLFGPVPALALQAGLAAIGVFPVLLTPARPPRPERPQLDLGELRAGLVEVAGSSVLKPVMLMALMTGVFVVGPFMVLIPLLVRDQYAGGATEMGILSGMFPLGALVGGSVILWRGGIRRNGRALGFGYLAAAGAVSMLAADLPFQGTVAVVFTWGLTGSVFVNTMRTLFQQHASEANRARVLSVYTLGVLGGGPAGSLLSGFLAGGIGLHSTLLVIGIATAATTLVVLTTTRLRQL